MADDPDLPHPYVRRGEPRLGEWYVDCGRGAWHPVHGRRQPDPGLLIEETDDEERWPRSIIQSAEDERRADDAHMAAMEDRLEHEAEENDRG